MLNYGIWIVVWRHIIEDWRYWYEGGKSSDCIGWKDFHILIETLDELIEKLIQ